MKPSKSASTSSTRIGSSMAWSRNAFTACSVTVDTIPRAPTPTRAAARTSGFSSAVASTIEPSPAMSRSPTMRLEMLPKCQPVPWVAVDVAPAIDW